MIVEGTIALTERVVTIPPGVAFIIATPEGEEALTMSGSANGDGPGVPTSAFSVLEALGGSILAVRNQHTEPLHEDPMTSEILKKLENLDDFNDSENEILTSGCLKILKNDTRQLIISLAGSRNVYSRSEMFWIAQCEDLITTDNAATLKKCANEHNHAFAQGLKENRKLFPKPVKAA